MKIDYTLYLVTDSQLAQGRSLVEEVIKAVKGGVTVVQLREKKLNSRAFYQLGMTLKKELSSLNIPLIINDRLDIALAVEADGLHIGQEDVPLKAARSILGGEKIIGFSAGNINEAVRGQREGADYLGLGPIFPTATKEDAASPTGCQLIADVKRLCNLPLVAIGGINADNLNSIKVGGADGAAVVSALMGASDIETAARKMVQIWKNA